MNFIKMKNEKSKKGLFDAQNEKIW